MSMERVPMTTTGFQSLEAELQRLKSEERPRIIQAIAEARAHGDPGCLHAVTLRSTVAIRSTRQRVE